MNTYTIIQCKHKIYEKAGCVCCWHCPKCGRSGCDNLYYLKDGEVVIQHCEEEMRELKEFLLLVGIENVWCKTHNRPMADSLSITAHRHFDKKLPEFFCEAHLELPQISECVFVRREKA